jgi:hypothetical protein
MATMQRITSGEESVATPIQERGSTIGLRAYQNDICVYFLYSRQKEDRISESSDPRASPCFVPNRKPRRL